MLNLIKDEIDKRENIGITENGAKGYKSTDSALVDMNYKVSSFRNDDEDEIIACFDKAFIENKEYALRWLFFARDIREGLGERRLFRICYRRLFDLNANLFYQNLHNISEFGRWDDLVFLIGFDKNVDEYISHMIKTQLYEDLNNIVDNQPISLLGKWLPSENASSKKTKVLAKKVRKLLKISSKEYRLMLSKLRKYLKVVETQMCANKWDSIDYSQVPSLANLRYKDAFLMHDSIRRRNYLASVVKGEAKLNMQVATPVDVVSRYSSDRGLYSYPLNYDETLELAWKNLKDVMVEETLVVADGSGSMMTDISASTTALDVANALAIYTSEHNTGVYKNKYITFSNEPRFVEFKEDDFLCNKLMTAYAHSEVSNTNIEAVFDLILAVAVQNDIPQEEMIKNILIISDMEFDSAQSGWAGWDNKNTVLSQTLFDEIKERYAKAGYKLPKLIFWNVDYRTKVIPLVENELGVALLSGFSQNVLKMAMSSKYDPYEVLIETIMSPRYNQIYV